MKKIINAGKNEMNNFFKEFKENFKDLKKSIKTKKNMNKHIPNIISITRPVLFLPLIIFKIINQQLVSAGILTIIASLSDSLDGTLARRLKAVSPFGAKLDVVCDKLFALIIGCLLLPANFLILIPMLLEVTIGIIMTHFQVLGRKPRVSYIGKAKTVFLDVLLCSLFFKEYPVIASLSNGFLISTVLLQVGTVINYYSTYKKIKTKVVV